MQTNSIGITVGEELYRFESFADWERSAEMKLPQFRVGSDLVIAVDSIGRIIRESREFLAAIYPIRVYVASVFL